MREVTIVKPRGPRRERGSDGGGRKVGGIDAGGSRPNPFLIGESQQPYSSAALQLCNSTL